MWTTDGWPPLVYFKLTLWAFSSGELIIWLIFSTTSILPVNEKTRLKQCSSSSANSSSAVSEPFCPRLSSPCWWAWLIANRFIATIWTRTCQGKLCDVMCAGRPAASFSDSSSAFDKSGIKRTGLSPLSGIELSSGSSVRWCGRGDLLLVSLTVPQLLINLEFTGLSSLSGLELASGSSVMWCVRGDLLLVSLTVPQLLINLELTGSSPLSRLELARESSVMWCGWGDMLLVSLTVPQLLINLELQEIYKPLSSNVSP